MTTLDRPARFLFVTWHAHGGLAPLLALARDLADRGHRVRVLGDPPSAPLADRAGLELETWRTAPAPSTADLLDVRIRDWEVRGAKRLKLLVDDLAYGPAALHGRDVVAAYRDDPVDVMVAEQFLPGAVVAAEALGCRSAIVMPNLDMRPSPERPPPGPGFAPARGPLGRLRDRVVGRMVHNTFARGLPPLNDARAELGLEPLTSVHEVADRVDLVLVLTAPSFDWSVTAASNVHYVGPVLDDPVWGDDSETTLPEGDAPLVLVSLGTSMQDQRDLYRRIIEALEGLEVRGLVTLGGVLDPSELEAPGNVEVVGTVPHGPIFRHASAAVVHCGHGSVMRALTAGVPIVGLPLGRDQSENAVRVAARGAGVRLSPRASTRRIRGAIRSVVHDPAYRAAAADLGARIRAETRPGAAVRRLEQLAAISTAPEVATVRHHPEGDRSGR